MEEETYMDLCYHMLSKMYSALGKQEKIHIYMSK